VLYLAVVIDCYSRRVVGWAMAEHRRAELVIEAVEMAIWQRKPDTARWAPAAARSITPSARASSRH